MKGYVLFVCLLLCAVGFVQAQSFSTSGEPKGEQTAPPLVPGPNSITQSNNTGTIYLNSVVCLEGTIGSTQNQYLRRFFLAADHGIVNKFDVQSVDFGVEHASNAGGTQPLTVNLYTIANGAPFLYANMTMIGSMGTTIPDGNLTFEQVAVTGSVADPNTQDLVVEIVSPDLRPTGGYFYMGSNADGQTRPSYIAAAYCFITEPTDIADIGFPNMQIIMVVSGTEISVLATGPAAGGASRVRRYQAD